MSNTPFPGVFTTQQFDEAFRVIPTADLLAGLEADRWLALELADHPPSRAYCELMINRTVKELERRQRLLAARPNDPLAPRWPQRPRLEDRFATIKAQWPLEHFVRTVLHCHLKPVANGEHLGHCPLPGHDDSSPSFRVYPDGHAHCFGCQQGGDVITLARIFFELDRNYDALTLLEDMAGLRRAA